MSADTDRPSKCGSPTDSTVLADYWLGTLNEAEESAVEEHLLACDECGERLREVILLAEGIRNLAQVGSLRMVVNDTFLNRVAGKGLRVRQYAPPRGGSVQCTVTAEDDILIGRLAADLKGARRVDLLICDQQGAEQLRLKDIPINTAADTVILQESISFAKAAPNNVMLVRMVKVDDAGGEHLLGEYTFNHTRSLPGPGAW